MPPRLSIVIALHDDASPETILGLADQTLDPREIELVVVDGWHHEPSWHAAGRAAEKVRDRLAVRLLRVPRAGRGACWNRGIAETTAPLILLLADDFVPRPVLVEEHLRLHERRPEPNVVGIGPAVFPPELRDSPFRRWLEDSGRLFGVSFTRPDAAALRRFFYGANTSLKRTLVERVGGFHEAFRFHGVEDFEMGLRLFELGAEVVFLPAAMAEHPHRLTLSTRSTALAEAGASLHVVDRLHPAPFPWHLLARQPAWRLARSVVLRGVAATLWPTDRVRARYYRAAHDRAVARGYRRAAVPAAASAPAAAAH